MVQQFFFSSDDFFSIYPAIDYLETNCRTNEQDEDYPANHHHRASEESDGQRLLLQVFHTDDTHRHSVQASPQSCAAHAYRSTPPLPPHPRPLGTGPLYPGPQG